jgi:hypothetical protein
MTSRHVLVVGAGQAGGALVAALRSTSFDSTKPNAR